MNKEEFDERFSEKKQCWEYIYNQRWENKFVCPRCGNNIAWFGKLSGKCKCANTKFMREDGEIVKCSYSHAVTTGTIFHMGVSIEKWFEMIWYLSADSGMDKVTNDFLHTEVKISKHALVDMRKRLAPALVPAVNYQLDMLSDIVEIDIAPIKVHGNNLYLAVAAEAVNRKTRRIRGTIINNDSPECVSAFLGECVEKGTRIISNLPDQTKDTIKRNGFVVLSRYGFVYKLYSANNALLELHSCVKESLAREEISNLIDRRCAEFNSRLLKVPFEELIQRAVSINPDEQMEKK